jgi:hypothetical protein
MGNVEARKDFHWEEKKLPAAGNLNVVAYGVLFAETLINNPTVQEHLLDLIKTDSDDDWSIDRLHLFLDDLPYIFLSDNYEDAGYTPRIFKVNHIYITPRFVMREMNSDDELYYGFLFGAIVFHELCHWLGRQVGLYTPEKCQSSRHLKAEAGGYLDDFLFGGFFLCRSQIKSSLEWLMGSSVLD